MASDGTLKCKYCDTIFDNPAGLYQHNKQHSCKVCKKIFPKISDVMPHIKSQHDEAGMTCKYCQITFLDSNELFQHNKKHVCQICKKIFRRISDVKSHQLEHTQSKDSESPKSSLNFKCIYCNLQLKTMYELTEHHNKHECLSCRKSFNKISDCDNHMKLLHSIPAATTSSSSSNTGFSCKICNIHFNSPFELMEHVCSSPTDKKRNHQSIIQSSSSSKENNDKSRSNNSSLLTKKKKISIQCDTCCVDFDSIELVTEHKKNCKKEADPKFGLLSDIPSDLLACIPSFQSPENSPKKVNSAAYSGQSVMPSFELIKVAEEPKIRVEVNDDKEKYFKCNICFKVYECEPEYVSHTCSKKVPLVCLVCGNIYHTLSGFRGHPCAIKNGLGELMQSCEVCEESFLWISDYQKHVNLKHSKIKCVICPDAEIFDEATYTFHIDTQHKAVCKRCSTRFYTNKELNIHFTLQHSDDNSSYKFVCCKCFTVCHTSKDLFDHYKTHNHVSDVKKRTGSGLFVCPKAGCNAAFKGMNSLNEHINTKHQEELEATRQAAQPRVKSVTPSTKLYPWSKPSECKVCKEVFPSITVLKAHQKVHIKTSSDKGPFPCITCGRTISSYRNLKKHRIGCLKKDREKKKKEAYFDAKESKGKGNNIIVPENDSNVEVLIQSADVAELSGDLSDAADLSDADSKEDTDTVI